MQEFGLPEFGRGKKVSRHERVGVIVVEHLAFGVSTSKLEQY